MTKVTTGGGMIRDNLRRIAGDLGIGILAAALYWLLRLVLPVLPVAALTLAALVLLDRARGLSGLAHTADALGGAHDAAARLRIVADTRLGSFGTVAIIAALLIQFAALASLPDAWALPLLLMLPTISRWSGQHPGPGWPLAALAAAVVTYGGALLIAGGGLPPAAAVNWPSVALWALAAAAGMLLFGAGTGRLMVWYLRRRFGELPAVTGGFMTARAQIGWLVIAAIVANLNLI
jgi:cobalamin synthase